MAMCESGGGGEEPPRRRIACVGSSVTKGTGLAAPALESYPVQLAAFLEGTGYPAVDVRNFGEGGAGVLKRGCNPFWETNQFGDALSFDPDVVVVLLGTNDAREEFWGNDQTRLLRAKENVLASFAEEEEAAAAVHGELEFEQDLEDLLEIFGRMPADPQIVLCTPAPLFSSSGWLSPVILRDEIAPRIHRVAARSGLRLVELLDSPLAQRPDLFPDGLHPSATGAAEIAALIGQALLELEQGAEQEQLTAAAEQRGEECREDRSAEDAVEEERQILARELSKMCQAAQGGRR